MKVLFHIPLPFVGGAELHIKYLIQNLSEEIQPYITYEYKEAHDFVSKLGVPYEQIHSPATLAKVVERIHPDIIHFYHSKTMYAALRRLSYRPKVYEVVHNRTPFSGDATTYGKEFTNAVVCVSPDTQSYFSSRVQFPSLVIPNGIPDIFKKREKTIENKRPLGGFVGRLEEGPGKGIPRLIEIIRDLPADFELVGDDQGHYAGYIADQEIKNIKVLPFTTAPEECYARWDFFVSRSPAEGFGLAIAEALASGLPAAIYDCGGICNFLEHGKHALIARNDDELEANIQKIIQSEVALEPLAVDFSAVTMARAYESLYHSLMQSGTARQPFILPSELRGRADLVLGVTVSDWHGVKRALAPLVDYVVTPDMAISAMRNMRPKVVVFGCFMGEWGPVLREAKALGCKTVLTWHASYILNEFDNINRVWMYESLAASKSGLFDFVATPHEGLAQTWTHFGIKADYLPNVVEVPLLKPFEEKEPLRIGIFGSGQPWKNMDCQIVAASMLPEAQVYIQNVRSELSLSALGIKVNSIPFVKNDQDYYRYMALMKVNLCMSLSEVYSYFTIESFLLGTPVLTTPITPVLKDAPEILQLCRNPHFEDPMEIKRGIERILADYPSIQAVGRQYMLEWNERNRLLTQSIRDTWLT